MEFKDGCLHKIYFHEIWWLSDSIKKKTELIFEQTPLPEIDGQYLCESNSELHYLIASVLSDAANLKKLIVTHGAKSNNDKTRRHYKFRLSRAKALNDFLEGVELKEMFNHKIRNTLEHFDEYLDEVNVDFDDKRNITSPLAAYNMVVSHRELFSPHAFPIRIYISSERMFYNMKWKVDIGKLHIEASSILERIKESGIFSKLDTPGGLMVLLKDAGNSPSE